MKRNPYKILLYVLSGVALFLFACEEQAGAKVKYNPANEVRERATYDERFTIVQIDGCEYIVFRHYEGGYSSYSSGITHKGNCKNHPIK